MRESDRDHAYLEGPEDMLAVMKIKVRLQGVPHKAMIINGRLVWAVDWEMMIYDLHKISEKLADRGPEAIFREQTRMAVKFEDALRGEEILRIQMGEVMAQIVTPPLPRADPADPAEGPDAAEQTPADVDLPTIEEAELEHGTPGQEGGADQEEGTDEQMATPRSPTQLQ